MSASTLTTERPAAGRAADRRQQSNGAGTQRGRHGRRSAAADAPAVPFHGILAVQDKPAFVRTSGYLRGTADVHASQAHVMIDNPRPAGAVVGAPRPPQTARDTHAPFG